MARRKYFLLIDTETTQTDKVADFGAIVCDRQGNIHASAALLIRDFYLDRDQHPLFHFSTDSDPLWGQKNLPKRYANYDDMLSNGSRMLASVAAVNRWLAKVAATYAPVMTAYNLSFDFSKMSNTGLDVDLFPNKFCLWHSAAEKWAHGKPYRQFILDNHLFKNRTNFGNMSFPTNAEVMARFILGDASLPNEPHTAFEDARDYELPILKRLIETVKPAQYMTPKGYSWRDYQVRDHFAVK